jgi:hypothetical protein
MPPRPPMPRFQTEPSRSPFVTRVAWYSILVYGMATLVSALYGLAPLAVPPPRTTLHPDLAELISWLHGSVDMTDSLAPRTLPIILNSRVGMLIGLALNVGTLIGAVGLLRRRLWAHRAFIAMLTLSNIDGAASLILDVVPPFRTLWAIGLIASAFVSCWIVFKLQSTPIRAEFEASDTLVSWGGP